MKVNTSILSSLLACKTNQHNFHKFWDNLTYETRLVIAQNKDTPGNILEFMVNDRDIYIIVGLTENPSITPGILEILAKDGFPSTRAAVGKSPKTPMYILEILANDDSWYVRESVVNNPSTQTNILTELSKDVVPSIRRTAKYRLR